MKSSIVAVLLLAFSQTLCAAKPATPRDSATILAESAPSDWRPLDLANTLYLDLAGGRVVIELAPAFAPRHVERIKALVAAGTFNGQFITRVQDNYVVQWGDGEHAPELAKPLLPPELFISPIPALPFAKLKDGDLYAPEVGHVNSLPAARNRKSKQAWLTHCYGAVGVGRDMAPDSGSGAELYVVIGHAPRHLDRNVTVVGRVLQGMPLLASLPRGTGALGFFEKPEQRIPLARIQLASAVPEAERSRLEVLRSDTPTWQAFVDARRKRREDWFIEPVGHIELCNVPVPVRPVP